MNLLETLANNPELITQLARSAGVGQAEARTGIEQLVPALSPGLQRNAGSQGGLDALLGALQGGGHQRCVEEPERLGRPDAIAGGNAILGHIFGSKEVGRNVASHAAQQSGLSADLLKQLLTMLAAAAMGTVGQQAKAGGSPAAGQGSHGQAAEGGAGDLLGQFLDADRDGSVLDDVLGMAAKFF
jgi:hypothetical protein